MKQEPNFWALVPMLYEKLMKSDRIPKQEDIQKKPKGKVIRVRKDKIMSSIEEVRKIMGFGDNFHMCDVSEVAEDHIHLESWD